MRAIRVHQFGPTANLMLDEIPRPVPSKCEVLVEVYAAGVGLWDSWIRSGGGPVTQSLPLVPGSDIAGVVREVGADVAGLRVGDAVFGVTNARFVNGYAEFAIASAALLSSKPVRATFVQAASMPVVAVTAWQMLFEHAKVQPGNRVLILGAAGNVGEYAVQFCRQQGIRVIALINTDNGAREHLKAIGAQEVIDGRSLQWLQKVDVVIDLVGGEAQRASLVALKRGGKIVSAVGAPNERDLASHQVQGQGILVSPRANYLSQIAKHFDAGDLVANVGTVLPLESAREAHEMVEGSRPHERGKIVLAVKAES